MKKLIMTMLVLVLLFTFVAQGFAFDLNAVINSGGEALFGQLHTTELSNWLLEFAIYLLMQFEGLNRGQAIKIIKTFI
jgi:hypothetical protein